MPDPAPGPREWVDALELYAPLMLDLHHRELSHQLMQWLMRHCTCRYGPARHARDACHAAASAILSAPPGQSAIETFASARHLAVIVLADDSLDGGNPDFMISPVSADLSEAASCHQSLIAELRRLRLPTASYQTSTRDMFAQMRQEQTVTTPVVSPSKHRAIRRHTIGLPSFVACRQTLRNTLLPHRLTLLPELRALPDLGWEIGALANDLASMTADAPPPDEPRPVSLNFVWQAVHNGTDLPTAIQAAIDRHNGLVERFEHTAHTVDRLATSHADPRIADLAHLWRSSVNGFLKATRHLATHRYPGSESVLGTLQIIRTANEPQPS